MEGSSPGSAATEDVVVTASEKPEEESDKLENEEKNVIESKRLVY